MEALIVFGFLTALLVVFDVLAMIFGVDTRPEFDDPHKPAGGITVI